MLCSSWRKYYINVLVFLSELQSIWTFHLPTPSDMAASLAKLFEHAPDIHESFVMETQKETPFRHSKGHQSPKTNTRTWGTIRLRHSDRQGDPVKLNEPTFSVMDDDSGHISGEHMGKGSWWLTNPIEKRWVNMTDLFQIHGGEHEQWCLNRPSSQKSWLYILFLHYIFIGNSHH